MLVPDGTARPGSAISEIRARGAGAKGGGGRRALPFAVQASGDHTWLSAVLTWARQLQKALPGLSSGGSVLSQPRNS